MMRIIITLAIFFVDVSTVLSESEAFHKNPDTLLISNMEQSQYTFTKKDYLRLKNNYLILQHYNP